MSDQELKAKWMAWGDWMRNGQPSGYPKKNVLGRVQDEGAASGSGSGIVDHIPIRDCPENLAEINRQWLTAEPMRKRVLYLRFVRRTQAPVSAAMLGISRRTLFRLLNAGMKFQ